MEYKRAHSKFKAVNSSSNNGRRQRSIRNVQNTTFFIRQINSIITSDYERPEHGVNEPDCCWGADGAERVQLRCATGTDGVRVLDRKSTRLNSSHIA